MTISYLTMMVFLSLSLSSFFKETNVLADKIECKKKDECSCVTDTKPPKQISLWQMNKNLHIYGSGNNMYAVDLCRHNMNITMKLASIKNKGCQMSTVCQYQGPIDNPKKAFELGYFGSVTFKEYDDEHNSMVIHYVGKMEGNITRSITLTLMCVPNKTKADYQHFKASLFNPTEFTGTITAKEACLIPIPKSETSKNKGLGTASIIIIVIGLIIFICLCGLGAYSVIKKKRSILEDDENEDYGTYETPNVHIQDASGKLPV